MSNSAQKYPQMSSPSSSPTEIEAHHLRPWPDLPPHLTELILQRLSLPDHIRLAAVCSNWRSIVRDHQNPPMLKLPWLISGPLKLQDSVSCCSPFEQKSCLSPFPITLSGYIFGMAHGWLLLVDDVMKIGSTPTLLHLLNPVSGSIIKLPELLPGAPLFFGFVSSAPTNADCTVILLATPRIFLWRIGDPDWTRLSDVLESHIHICEGSFCGRILYCKRIDGRFFFMDLAQSVPSFQLLDLDRSLIRPSRPKMDLLVESNGEILLAQAIMEYADNHRHVVGFKVFRADLVRKMWVRMETLGGRVLFVNPYCSFSLSAAEAGVGENCIYFAPYMFETSGRLSSPWKWKVFDLRSERIVDGPLILPNVETGYDLSQFESGVHWFVPNLDVVGRDATVADGTM